MPPIDLPSAKPYSLARLTRSAEYYLARYATSSANLRRVLERRLFRHGSEAASPEEQAQWLDTIISEMQRLGYVNDTSYGEMALHSLRRRGTSRTQIAQRLSLKGLDKDHIQTLLNREEDSDIAEQQAALAYLRRTRRGPFRTGENTDDHRRKDQQALQRQGFSWRTVQAVLDAPSEEFL